MIAAQLVLAPLLALFIWGYVALRPATGRGARMVAFDTVVILAAIVSSVAAGWWVAAQAGWWVAAHETGANGSVWSTVMVTVSTFHVFPAVLLAGWYVRRRLF